jgi:hypothetical protein
MSLTITSLIIDADRGVVVHIHPEINFQICKDRRLIDPPGLKTLRRNSKTADSRESL